MSTNPAVLANVILNSANFPGQPVTVSAAVLSVNPVVFEITATIGTTTLTERHAIGADGAGPMLAGATLLTALDGYRQAVADKAAWQANAAAAASALK